LQLLEELSTIKEVAREALYFLAAAQYVPTLEPLFFRKPTFEGSWKERYGGDK